MSKIALEPNAAGTGTFTIASPNSNTSRTLTLPDADGALLTTTGDGSQLTGIDTTPHIFISIRNFTFSQLIMRIIKTKCSLLTGLMFELSRMLF